MYDIHIVKWEVKTLLTLYTTGTYNRPFSPMRKHFEYLVGNFSVRWIIYLAWIVSEDLDILNQ